VSKLRELLLILRIIASALTPPGRDLFEKVERYLRSRLDNGNDSDVARLFLAEIYSVHKRYRDAKRELLQVALRSGPYSGRARTALGIACFHLKEYEDSLRYLESARGKSRYSARIEHYRSFAHMNLGAWNEAIEGLLDARVHAVDPVRSMDAIAYCYFQLGELEKAVAYYRKAIDLDPDSVPLRTSAARAHAALANRHTENSRYVDATAELELALAISPPDADTAEIERTIRVLEQEVRSMPRPRSLSVVSLARPRTAPPSSPPSCETR
jgi:tetratricopeptide (TPR) repeat protein